MKRLSSSDSLGGLMSICPNATVSDEGNHPIYAMLDEEGCIEESGHISEKKRRLSIDQVKALEKNFELENKLEPERKLKLAQDLALQPRQVAVWFQNRRARWKTKQLERDYGVLKANYDGLKINFESLKHDNQSLHKEIQELKSKLNGEENVKLKIADDGAAAETENEKKEESWPKFGDLKDGSSDSDSSAILNDDNNSSPLQLFNGSSSNLSFQIGEMKESASYEPQFVKIEEHNFLGEESCSTLFSDDQPPTLQWYCNDEWN